MLRMFMKSWKLFDLLNARDRILTIESLIDNGKKIVW